MLAPESALAMLALAVVLDVTTGEYPRLVHPVVWIGKWIELLLHLAPAHGRWKQFAFGTMLALITVGLSVGLTWTVLYLARPLPWFEVALGGLLLKASFALRELGRAADRVVREVEASDLEAARLALRALCSRDPSRLSADELLAGAVQSLAENASDSVIAPLFYFLVLGIPGAIAYRAINTLDAMVGYRGPMEALGKFSARLDDVVNWIPARLTALLLLLAGALLRLNPAAGWRICRRDAAATPSPNGGRPMAVIAGLLKVRLDKPGCYSLGDAAEALSPAKARTAWHLVVCCSLTMVLLCAACLGLRLLDI